MGFLSPKPPSPPPVVPFSPTVQVEQIGSEILMDESRSKKARKDYESTLLENAVLSLPSPSASLVGSGGTLLGSSSTGSALSSFSSPNRPNLG